MRKYTLLLTALLSCLLAEGQEPAIKTALPTVIPPSPTVSSLMKFNEVPVSNYTGIPDISIPVLSVPTLSKDINLNISLKYHPGAAAATEVASDVGLGWSLFAGGTISRTVRGLPDEYYRESVSGDETGKIGIYRDNGLFPFKNSLHLFVDDVTQGGNYLDEFKEYLWETSQKGKYDTEYDSWQYNFMGHSGKFVIKKNSSGVLEVANQNLDDNLKIVNHYQTGNANDQHAFRPTSFDMYDDHGYKFVFDVIEETQSDNSTQGVYFGLLLYPYDYYLTATLPIIYRSAFHLSKVYDNNANLILEYKYNSDTELMEEITVDKSYTVTQMESENPRDFLQYLWILSGYDDTMQGQNKKLEPKEVLSMNTRKVKTKKIKEIDNVGISKTFLEYVAERYDTDYNASSYRLKSITQKTWNTVPVKKIQLYHGYSEIIKTRMVLDSVVESNFEDTLTQSYRLEYEVNDTGEKFVGKDYWGNFNLRPFLDNGGTYRETTPSFCTSDLLQKMVLPSGGSIIYDFESNRYSYVGADELPNYDENPENWIEHTANTSFTTTSNNRVHLFTIYDKQTVAFETNMVNTGTHDWRFNFYKVNTSPTPDTFLTSFSQLNCESENCVFYYPDLEPGQYKVEFSTIDMDFPEEFSATITANYKTRAETTKQYVYGGGNRIKRIGYFTENVPKNYYRESPQSVLPAKEVNYSYTFFDNALKSSGSLVFAKPKYDFTFNRIHHFAFHCYNAYGDDMGICTEFLRTFVYHSFTDFNNLMMLRTQGADVGYQNVTMYEVNNGRTEYTYSSPIDVPESEEAYIVSLPFEPSENFDFKRGLIQLEKIFDKNSKILKETSFDYDIEEIPQNQTSIGLLTHDWNFNCPYSYMYTWYNYGPIEKTYKGTMDWCDANPGTHGMGSPFYGLCGRNCGDVFDFIWYKQVFEANGWAKLKQKATKEYFYPGSSTSANILATTEKFTYNSLNKQMKTQSVSNSKGQELETDYYYHTGNSTFSDNRISEIERMETYRSGTLLSTSQVVYDNAFSNNSSYLPRTIETAKETASLEPRLQYTQYDTYGHPLEVQQENGMTISYIWGYNKTVPIAKIENATNAEIETALGMTMAAANESNMSLINALRTTLPNAMITTYTYKPLVGVETIIDPKGLKQTFTYDSFGRLKTVKDYQGNTLSKNDYHYRTQN